jgi:hypothetical protein
MAEAQDMSGYHIADHLLIKAADEQLKRGPEAESVEGTPYLDETFVTGHVYSRYGNYKGISMRYNIYEDHIEFRQKDLIYILDPDLMIKKVDLGEQVLVVENYEFRMKTQSGFLTLLDSGKVTLLSKKVVTYREQQPPKALESAPTPAQYSMLPDVYYYKIGNGEVMKVQNIKKMISSFPDKHQELTQFAKKEKLSHKNEADMIALVRHYNTL